MVQFYEHRELTPWLDKVQSSLTMGVGEEEHHERGKCVYRVCEFETRLAHTYILIIAIYIMCNTVIIITKVARNGSMYVVP